MRKSWFISTIVMAAAPHANATMPVAAERCLFTNHSAELTPDVMHVIARVSYGWLHPTFFVVHHYTVTGLSLSDRPETFRIPVGFQVQGFANEFGLNDEENRRLGLQRALAVARKMTQDGVPESVITIVGYSNSAVNPEDPHATYNQIVDIEEVFPLR